jgi:shikimate dehydrogenase
MIRRIDHVGILVRSLAEAVPLYTERLGLEADPPVELTEQQVRVQFLHVGSDRIELLQPTSSASTLEQVLAKRGEGLLHICLEVDDLEATLRELEGTGVRRVDAHPGTSPHGLAAFLHPKSFRGVSIELRQAAARTPAERAVPVPAPETTALQLSGRTKACFSLGYPIAQSLSPAMQTAAFRTRGLEWVYLPWSVPADALPATVQALRANDHFAGGNVTAPHKERIIPLLDALTPEAARVAAVNVVFRDGERLVGHTTDGPGYVAALREEGYDPRGKRVLLLGAGGAAKAVGLALVDAGAAEIRVLNRTAARAEAVARLLAAAGCSRVQAGRLGEAESAVRQADLVVNATSIGLQKDAPPLFDYGLLPPTAFVSDLVFFPRETPFLRAARAQGCRTMNGLGMLLHQAVLSFERWTGLEAPKDVMREVLTAVLDQRERTA